MEQRKGRRTSFTDRTEMKRQDQLPVGLRLSRRGEVCKGERERERRGRGRMRGRGGLALTVVNLGEFLTSCAHSLAAKKIRAVSVLQQPVSHGANRTGDSQGDDGQRSSGVSGEGGAVSRVDEEVGGGASKTAGKGVRLTLLIECYFLVFVSDRSSAAVFPQFFFHDSLSPRLFCFPRLFE